MARNIEELFGGIVEAPHQIPYTYTSTIGGETFISLPFTPVSGVVTINGSVQVPLDNFVLDGNTLNLGRELEIDDVVYCLFDKVLSPQDTQTSVRIYKFKSVGGETTFTPDFTAFGVQTLYIDGKYQVPGVDYTYSSKTGVVSLTTPLAPAVWVSAEMTVKQSNSSLSGDDGASKIGTASGNTVQEELDINLLNDREQWRRSLAEAGLTLVDGSFEEGATVNSKTDAVWYITGGQCYTWGGALPKTVGDKSTPSTTGGIAIGAWQIAKDASIAVYTQPFTNAVEQTQTQRNAEYVRPEEFGAKHTSGVDDTIAFHKAIASGKKLMLGAFTYYVNIVLTDHFDIEGQGMARTKLVAFDKTKPVIKNMFRELVWNYPSLRNMTLEGGGTLEGVGLAFGDIDSYTAGDENIGRVRVTDVFITNFDKAIQKTSGNIGNVFENVSTRSNNYYYWAQGAYQAGAGPSNIMHAGADIFIGGQVSDTKKMCVFVMDTTPGTGHWLWESTIFQFNPGGLAWFDVTGTSFTSYQAVAWHNIWNEQNGTASSVTIDGLSGPQTITPSDRPVYTQMGFDHYELGKVWKHGTDSQHGQVNIWGEGRTALALYGGGFSGSTSDTTRISFLGETNPNQAGAYISSTCSGGNGVGRDMVLGTALGESIRMAESGGVTIGVASNAPGVDAKAVKIQADVVVGQRVAMFSAPFSTECRINMCDGVAYNSALSGMQVGAVASTSRSINASGTINASGADYAEYMEKSEDCADIGKGDICGVTASGLLTDKYDKSIAFVIKSTDPSYVGGDTWGGESEPSYHSDEYIQWQTRVLSLENSMPVKLEESKSKSGETEEEYAQRMTLWEKDIRSTKESRPKEIISEQWISWREDHEVRRARVDRIAFSGQVPCNVYGCNPGDYIVPQRMDDGSIVGVAVTNPDFGQYKMAVGVVWKVLEDGRAWVAVKVV